MNAAQIVTAIDKRVMSAEKKDYSIWTIGITADPDRRRTEHGTPKHWMQWQADTEAIARGVEKHFLDKGMKGDTGGGERPTNVYIF
jgi:hypothetical protein